MAVFKCKICGGSLKVKDGDSVITCDYCGTKQTVPKISDEKRANLYDRANHYRRNNEYDKAAALYEQILNEDKTDAEAYWSIMLCKYGVEYVEDFKTKKRVPTLNRVQYASVLSDEDYKAALKYADDFQRQVYEADAKEIENIQKGILEVSKKEEPFDIFICYKETDVNGRRTQDSVLAQELYDNLTKEGYRVFFSRKTLENKLGVAFEPFIFAALNSAKVMVVLGTSLENFNSLWVKNEWGRYLTLIKNGAKKTLIPAYKKMDAYDLPEEFSHLQALNMEKLGFMQDLVDGIKKILGKSEKRVTASESIALGANWDSMLKRAYMALADGSFEEVKAQVDKLLDINPESAEAYLLQLLANVKLKDLSEVTTYPHDITKTDNYARIMRYGDDELKNKVNDAVQKNAEYKENTKKFNIYSEAIDNLLYIDNPAVYEKVVGLLNSVAGYKDSDNILATLPDRRNNVILTKIEKDCKDAKSLTQLEQTKKSVDELSTEESKKRAQNIIKEVETLLIYALAQSFEKKKKFKKAAKNYGAILDYKDSKERLVFCNAEAKKIAIRNRKICVVTAVVCVLSCVISISCLIVANVKAKNEAKKLQEEKELKQGYDISKTEDGTGYVIDGYELTDGNLIILPSYDGLPVTEIGDDAFKNKRAIVSVTLPDTIKRIGKNAFYGCISLTTINIPASVEVIDDGAFEDCSELTNITFESEGNDASTFSALGSKGKVKTFDVTVTKSALKKVGDYAFKGTKINRFDCSGLEYLGIGAFESTNLTSVVLPESITAVPEGCFTNCQSLVSATMHKGIKFIGDYSFFCCRQLKVEIPDGVEEIGVNAFGHCNSLKTIMLPNSVKKLDDGAFSNCYNFKSIEFGDSLVTIGNKAFYGCQVLESVNLPNSVEKIGDEAFYGCHTLSTLYLNDGLVSIGKEAFCDCYKLTNISIPDSVENMGAGLFYNCNKLHSLRLPFIGESRLDTTSTLLNMFRNDVNVIYPSYLTELEVSGGMFNSDCLSFFGITDLTIGSEPCTIQNSAFLNNSHIQSITFGDANISIEAQAIKGCGKLTSITLGENTTVNEQGFSNCSALAEVTVLGNAVVKANGFYNCTKIATLKAPVNNVPIITKTNLTTVEFFGDGELSDNACYGANKLTSVTFTGEVTGIGNNAFYGCTALTGITLPNSVLSIGDGAFSGCTALTEITLPHTVTSIGSQAFRNCSKLTGITLPASVTTIGSGIFYNCIKLEAVLLSANITAIPNDAFYGCSVLTRLTIPANVSTIGNQAFYKCIALDDVILNSSLESIGDRAFYGCSALTEISLPNSITSIGNEGFFSCKVLKNVVLNSGLESIGDIAFGICTSLEQITLPNTVTSIGSWAFSNCTNLATVTLSNSLTKISANAFSGCVKLTGIEIPTSVEAIENNAFNNCTLLSEVVLQSGIKTIGQNAFHGCSGLTEIAMSNTITSVGEYAFYNCSNLITVDLSQSLTAIPDNIFNGCSNLSEIIIPDSVTSIGNNAFRDCRNLINITLSSNLTTLGLSAFSGCSKLEEITIPDGITVLNSYVFGECTGLLNVNLPSGITVIQDHAFYGCRSLQSIDFPSGLQSINNEAFYNCQGLTELTLPDSIVEVYGKAFGNCTNLKTVYIPSTIQTLNEGCFYGCGKIESLTLPLVALSGSISNNGIFLGALFGTQVYAGGQAVKQAGENSSPYYIPTTLKSVTVIGRSSSNAAIRTLSGSFKNITWIETVTLGENVNMISTEAFSGCTGLTTVNMGSSVEIIENKAFYGCTALETITFPEGEWEVSTSSTFYSPLLVPESDLQDDATIIYDLTDYYVAYYWRKVEA